MKILWLSPVPPPALCRQLSIAPAYGGWWVDSMLQAISAEGKPIAFVVAWISSTLTERITLVEDGVMYVGIPEVAGKGRRMRFLAPLVAGLREFRITSAGARNFAAIVQELKPDLVQVFGSERPHGLAAAMIDVPLVLWLQGILDVYQLHYFGSMSMVERLLSPRALFYWWLMHRRAARERVIFQSCRYFVGRTDWDHAHQVRLNKNGLYFEVQDAFRKEFFNSISWSLSSSENFVIYTTTSPSLLKGTDVVVRAAGMLLSQFPKLELRIAGVAVDGNYVAKRLRRIIRLSGMSQHVRFLGILDASQISLELRRARVFVLPSFIENNPNSLGEAQLIGIPTISAYTGGVPNMVIDEDTGLLFQPGDSAVLAYKIKRLFLDETLALHLSANSRSAAKERYAPERIAEAMLGTYSEVINDYSAERAP